MKLFSHQQNGLSIGKQEMKLFSHQQNGLSIGKQGSHAFFWQCGTGKTLLGLELVKYWKAQGVGPALIVCPLSIIDVAWIEDAAKFTPELSIISLWSKKPAERKERLFEDHDIYVVNFEMFKLLYEDICRRDFNIIIVDESSKMKNPKSQITKALISLAGFGPIYKTRKNPYSRKIPIACRYILSGTPAPNDKSEYHQQIKFITGRGNKCFDDNFYSFRGKYFQAIPIGFTGHNRYEFRRDMRAEFMAAMKPVTHVVRKQDALDLPEQIHEIRKVYLSPHERNAYESFKLEKVLELQNETVLARTALTEVMKLRQFTSGFAYSDCGIIQTGKSKVKELKALLEEIGNHQVIIWANFKYEIRTLLNELPKKSISLWSQTPDKADVINAFINGHYQYLIANPQSAGHGLTFINCQDAIYFSLNYSYELQKQSQDRIHRIGQQNKCTYYYLIADKTIDEVILETIQKKDDLSSTILEYLRTGIYETKRSYQPVTV